MCFSADNPFWKWRMWHPENATGQCALATIQANHLVIGNSKLILGYNL